MRQGHTLREYDPKRGASVATLAYEYPKGYQVSEHAHGADQLIYAIRGLIHVWSGNRSWFIPPQFALWIPARKRHRLAMPSEVSMRTLYLAKAERIRTCAVQSPDSLLGDGITTANHGDPAK
jgi:quercetin dioxygenase-like cupin family protein